MDFRERKNISFSTLIVSEGKRVEGLKRAILKRGKIYPNNLLKVDSFINHQIDPELMQEIGKEFAHYFEKYQPTKVVTIESSGIAPALMAALSLQVPLVFAKKTLPSTLMKDDVYSADVFSFTKNVVSKVVISQSLLDKEERILIIDDFLANGEAVLGLKKIIEQAGASVCGVGILIEKSFQSGRGKLEEAGLDVYSLARVQSIENGEVTFLA